MNSDRTQFQLWKREWRTLTGCYGTKSITSKKLMVAASFCYCAYVMRISGYSETDSGFPWTAPTKRGIFSAVYNYAGKSYFSKGYWYPKRKLLLLNYF